MNSESSDSAERGAVLAAAAYSCWIIYPVYFKFLIPASALEIMAHRLCWSLLFMGLVLAWLGEWKWIPAALQNRQLLMRNFATGALLAANWLIYIFGVNSGQIVESSLGYFINPLISVLMGVLLLGERLRPAQWMLIALAAAGVLYLTYGYGQLPWISLGLAFTFALYGLLKKTATISATQGLTLETASIVLLGFGYLIYLEVSGQAHFLHENRTLDTLLVLSGPITAIPLLMYAAAAKRIPLYMLGLLQYIAPTGQFLIAVLVYCEDFPQYKQIGFTIIWVALILYWLEGFWQRRQQALVGA